MQKIKIFITLVLILSISHSQNDVEEMMRKIEEATQREMEETQKKVDQYISAQDSAFAAFLEQDWELYNTYTGLNNLEKPKLKKPPVAEPSQEVELPKKKIEDVPIPEQEQKDKKQREEEEPKPQHIVPKPEEKQPIPPSPIKKPQDTSQASQPKKPQPEPRIPEKKKTERTKPEPEIRQPQPSPEPAQPSPKESKPANILKIDFYGAPVQIHSTQKYATNISTPCNNKKISRAWKNLAATDYENIIDQLEQYRSALKLNGWGYYKLVNRLGQEINANEQNNAALFTWFMLLKSGYNVRVAYNKQRIYLLIPAQSRLYSVSFLTLDNERYYLINRSNRKDKIYTYKTNYPNADQKLELDMQREPSLGQQSKSKVLDFNYAGEAREIEVNYNPAIIEYLTDYPQTDYEIYFSAPLSNASKRQIMQELAPIIEGKSKTEAVNILLRFVQKSFQYQTDDLHFGREKPLFPEETLFYPFSDCEDRSVLFSYLVRNLLGMEVIGLKYPGHIATAINIEGPTRGDQLSYNGNNYLICDPTYINANIGQCMPKYRNFQPEIIFK